ncbi:MAG: glycosyltransferase [Nanoarchaeota archaeon]|nr:glycosyltransferase [Nanoarchaeota archaeon]MBU1269502.1 glycosyltransferase [Nanoarchaeota archaeon]MBU1603893.1 glycosyltransferase [Nanoarchaeota archaeon]
MIIEKRTHEDFKDLEDRPLDKKGRKISLILPARHEEKTIGNYFPTFANLMRMGCIDEVVIADSSDNSKTIDAAIDAAMNTHPFSNIIYRASNNGRVFPVKAVNVFDKRFAKLFNDHKPELGKLPGKGTAMYLGMAVATGDILLFLDADFQNIDPRFLYGLAGPFEDRRTILSKATFKLEDTYEEVIDMCKQNNQDLASCDLLLKSVNSRTLAKPMMNILDEELKLFPGIKNFNGPLSGGCGAPKEVWQSLMIPIHYGIEVSYLMQLVKMFPNGRYAYDVNLGEVIQESQDAEGRVRMGENIINTILHHIKMESPKLYREFSQNPVQLTNMYLEHAKKYATHHTDTERMNLYANIMNDALIQGEAINTPILPALNNNSFYLSKKQKIIDLANQAMYEKVHKQTTPNISVKINFNPILDKQIPAMIQYTPIYGNMNN